MKFVLGRVENILGKGENAAYQHFLLFTMMFSKGLFVRVDKLGLCGKELTLGKQRFENIVRKGQNAGNQHLHLFPKCFLLYQRKHASSKPQ